MTLDFQFREQVRLHPGEAQSHFEIVDPGAWRYDRAGSLVGLGDEWCGPYAFRCDGTDYEAFCLKTRLDDSQRVFLEDLGIAYETEARVPRFVWFGGAALALAVLVVGVWFVWRTDTSPVVEKESRRVTTVEELFGPPPVTHPSAAVVRPVEPTEDRVMIRERARTAFRAARWSEAIPLVDQLEYNEVDAELMYYIGICYKEGYAVGHDFAAALDWFRRSADLGNAAAQYEMGIANERGNGVAQNFPEAARWYRIAAERGNAPANLSLGILFDEGRGVAQNAAEAAKFYRKGGALGNAHANYLLGRLYEEGRGVPLDLAMAADCYRKAGTVNHALAGYLLGQMYENGRGVQKSVGEALYWYEKAGKLGNSAALSDWQRLRGTDKRWIHPEK